MSGRSLESQAASRIVDSTRWYSRDRYGEAPRRLRFRATNRREAEEWQKALRAKITELLEASVNPLTAPARCAGNAPFAGYRRSRVVEEAHEAVSVLAYVLVPDKLPRPAATVICVPGHGRGVDDIVGIDDDGHERTDKAGYQHDFAIQVVEAGMAAVAIEPMAFGCRRDPLNAAQGLSRKGCEPVAGGALMLGESMIGWRVWDVLRTLDYIATRPELDSGRVGCMGISGGGTTTLFSAALEPRIRAAMVSGYLNTFRDSIGSLAHCVDNYVPGILTWAEMYDVGGFIAPRPLFVSREKRTTSSRSPRGIESFERGRV
jgi:hypothetical protein